MWESELNAVGSQPRRDLPPSPPGRAPLQGHFFHRRFRSAPRKPASSAHHHPELDQRIALPRPPETWPARKIRFPGAIVATAKPKAWIRATLKMPTPRPRKKTNSVKIHVKNGTGSTSLGADGHASHYEFAYCADECPARLQTLARRARSGDVFTCSSLLLRSHVKPNRAPKPHSRRQLRRSTQLHRWSFHRHLSTIIFAHLPLANCKAFRTSAG